MRICGDTVDLSMTGYPSPSCILEKGHKGDHTDGMGVWSNNKPKKPEREDTDWVRNPGGFSEAHFARDQGWGPGTVLEGAPITIDGKQVEKGITWRITAFGESAVLARSIDEEGKEGYEHTVTFTARDWRVKP